MTGCIDKRQGLVLGKNMPPPFACLGAGKLEEDKIFPSERFQNLVLNDLDSQDNKDRFDTRFIDDKLAAFLGTKDQAVEFVNWLNTLWPGLTFTFEWSDRSIKFLNVEILITRDGLETNMYVKPTNPQLYLHYSSAHPPQVFRAIIYGQALNIKMICSKGEYVQQHLNNLKVKLENRGYPSDLVDGEIERALKLERTDLLKPKVYPHGGALTPLGAEKAKFKPTFILTYHPFGPNLRKWIREAFPMLQSDKKL